ncbi:MAG: retroviral-like aspartic protease family protein [bacterium]
MIVNVQYLKTRKQNGKITAPPQTALLKSGPFLRVTITHPRLIQEQYKKDGKPCPEMTVQALIDTGASCSIITPDVAKKLNLHHTGFQTIASVQGSQRFPVYSGLMVFHWKAAKAVPLVACPLKVYECLIGRDILQHWHLSYNGVNGTLTICD